MPWKALRMARAPWAVSARSGLRAAGVDQGGHVLHQPVDQIGRHLAGLGLGLAIAAQVRRPGAEAHLGQHRQLVAPAEAAFREAVQAERQPVALARLVHGEVEAIGGDPACGDAHGLRLTS
jgi:hypothetical protein